LFETDCGTWDENTLTYSMGENSVTVYGTTDVTLKSGTDTALPAGSNS
jgi:hypothetical protein